MDVFVENAILLAVLLLVFVRALIFALKRGMLCHLFLSPGL